MVFIGILIILLILALISANKIAEWINKQISASAEKKCKAEEKRKKRLAKIEQTQKILHGFFSHHRHPLADAIHTAMSISPSEVQCENTDNKDDSTVKETENVPSEGDTEAETVHRRMKENLRGPILGHIYYSPTERNLVSPFWEDEHSIYTSDKAESPWPNRYTRIDNEGPFNW